MRKSDGQVRGTLLALTMPIRQANWYIDPIDTKNQKIADILNENIFQNMTITWDNFLRQALTLLDFGFSIFEKVYKYQDGLIQLKKLAPRLQKSLYKWFRDKNGGLAGIQQYVQKGDTATFEYIDIPVKKLVLFVNDQEGSNFEGVSVLRSAYKHWYIKDQLYKVDAIGHDRFASGIPWMKEPEVSNQKDVERAPTILENLYSRERSYMLLPKGWEGGILEKSGGNNNILDSIKHHNEEIGKNVLAQFINLGTTGSGARAVAESFEELFMLAVNAVADGVADTFNRYVIKELVDFNWKVKEYPKLKHSRILINIHKFLNSLSTITSSQIITSDFELENKVRDMLGLPEKKEEKEEVKEVDNNQSQMPIKKEQKEVQIPEESKEEKEEDVQENKIKKEEKLSDIKLSEKRQLTDAEKVLANFAEIERAFDEGEQKLTRQIKKVRDQQAQQIARDIFIEKPDNLKVKYIGKMADRIKSEMLKSYKKGKATVRAELKSQRKDQMTLDDLDVTEATDEDIKNQIENIANDDSQILANSLMNSALGNKNALPAGLTISEQQNELYKRIKDTSKKEIKSVVSSAVNYSFGIGREMQAESLSEQIEYAVYSALLDAAACRNCLPKDGVSHALDDAEFLTPNVHSTAPCLGLYKCRCVNIYKLKEMVGDFKTKSRIDYETDIYEIEKGTSGYIEQLEKYQ